MLNDYDKENKGFVSLWRCITEWEWYADVNTFKLFMHCLLKANYKNKSWQGIEIKRGSFITSLDNLAFETGLTKMQVRTAIKKLKLTHEITCETTSRYSTITVNNYNLYQQSNTQDNTQITYKQHTDNIRVTLTNNDNNVNNENNILLGNTKNKNFIIPSLDEIKNYCIERDNNIDANRFYDYYSSKGWMVGKNKMKDWKAAIRNWERNNFCSNPISEQKQEVEDEVYNYGF